MGEVFEFTVNGQVQRTEEDKPLLRYLRDDLKLYSIHVIDFHAVIDREKCVACGMCATKCPRGVIHDADGIYATAF